MSASTQKIMVLDTSVFMQRPKDCIETFEDNEVVAPLVVLDEIDSLKHKSEKAHLARYADRHIEMYRKRGDLHDGVPTNAGGTFRVEFRTTNPRKTRFKLAPTNDNAILATAIHLQSEQSRNGRRPVILVSRDLNLRIKANACGVQSEDYTTDKIDNFTQTLYQGIITIHLKDERTDILSALHRESMPLRVIEEVADLKEELIPNECVIFMTPSGKSACALYRDSSKSFTYVPNHRDLRFKNETIKPRNAEQAFALALLMDPTIKVVTLAGKTGSGKTLLALLSGYELVCGRGLHDRILVYRPMVSVGRPMGYLPGTADEKLNPWKEPIYESLELISEGRQRDKGDGEHMHDGTYLAEELEQKKKLRIAPISFERGASRHNQFIIIDEAQNMTPHEILTLMTRVGERAKVVITGDPSQIDDPFLDAPSCGLVRAVVRLAGQPVVGHLCLQKSERSEIAELAATLLS